MTTPLLAPPHAVAVSDAYALASRAMRRGRHANAGVACRCVVWRRGMLTWDGACRRCDRGMLPS